MINNGKKENKIKNNGSLFDRVNRYFARQKEIAKSDFLKNDYDLMPEKDGLGLLGFLKIIKRHVIAFSTIVISIAIISFVLGSKFGKTLYYARGEIAFTSTVHSYLYTVVQEDLGTDKTAEKVATILAENNIAHNDGAPITPKEIRSGISSEHSSDSSNIIVFFDNEDSSIVSTTLNYTLDYIVNYYGDNHDDKHIETYITVGSYSSIIDKRVNQSPLYILLGTLGGLSLATGCIVLVDRIRKIISCPADIKLNDVPIISLNIRKNDIISNDFKEKLSFYFSGKKCADIIYVGNVNNKNSCAIKQYIKTNFDLASLSLYGANKKELVSVNPDDEKIIILIFENGRSSMKDLPYESRLNLYYNRENCVGVFIE